MFGRRRSAKAPDAGFDPAKIDLVSVSPDGAEVQLHIVSDAPWTGSDHQIETLQAKIHNYVAFALDGQMKAIHPDTQGLPWTIVINSQVETLDERTAEVIQNVAAAVRKYGGDLTLE